jgi:hypothetical protein
MHNVLELLLNCDFNEEYAEACWALVASVAIVLQATDARSQVAVFALVKWHDFLQKVAPALPEAYAFTSRTAAIDHVCRSPRTLCKEGVRI